MTQEQLAEACGISIWTLRGYEQSRREPGWKGAIKVARALGVAVEAFADCTSLHDDADQASARPRGRTRRRQRLGP
jgi:transcriptional regulator with XRE-family HTH domain